MMSDTQQGSEPLWKRVCLLSLSNSNVHRSTRPRLKIPNISYYNVLPAVSQPSASQRMQRTYATMTRAGGGSRAKKIKKSKAAVASVESDYSNFKVADLKTELRNKGLKVSGRKTELINRLTASQNED